MSRKLVTLGGSIALFVFLVALQIVDKNHHIGLFVAINGIIYNTVDKLLEALTLFVQYLNGNWSHPLERASDYWDGTQAMIRYHRRYSEDYFQHWIQQAAAAAILWFIISLTLYVGKDMISSVKTTVVKNRKTFAIAGTSVSMAVILLIFVF